jgi:hypothetical protein
MGFDSLVGLRVGVAAAERGHPISEKEKPCSPVGEQGFRNR